MTTALVTEAQPGDAAGIAIVHLAARAHAMPYLHRAHTDEETYGYFGRVVGSPPLAWWVIRADGVAAYMMLNGAELHHLYVLPRWQGRGLGSALLDKAKALSPGHLLLWTFQRNSHARAFYEARGFRGVRCTAGENEEREPDVLYEWRAG